MNGASLLIMLIVSLMLAATGAYLVTTVGTEIQQDVRGPSPQANIRLVEAIGQNITDGNISHIRFSITSDRPVKLNHTLITIQTPDDSARLQYRNGTLERNTIEGFYTQ